MRLCYAADITALLRYVSMPDAFIIVDARRAAADAQMI